MRGVQAELRDVAPGLWLWRVPHPDWSPEADWEPPVASTCVESGGEVALLDPIVPPDDADAVWERLDARPPSLLVVLKPDHVRDVDLFARRYGARAFGPNLFWRHDVPDTDLEPIEPGSELPGDLVALYDGRGRCRPGAADRARPRCWGVQSDPVVAGRGGTSRYWSANAAISVHAGPATAEP